jgi:hypothetical protein
MNDAPSAFRVERAMSAAMQVRDLLGDDPDERLLADALEGSTDVMELVDRLIERSSADAALVRAGKERLARIEARNERTRGLIARMLDALDLRRLERPLATLTLADARRGVVITDEDELPPAYLRTAPDKAAILSALNAGEVVPGAALSNGAGPVLTMRTK